MPLFILSNQRNTDTTFCLKGLDLHGHSHPKMAFDMPVPTKAHTSDMIKHANIVAATDALNANTIGNAHLMSDAQVLQPHNLHLTDNVAAQFHRRASVVASELLLDEASGDDPNAHPPRTLDGASRVLSDLSPRKSCSDTAVSQS